MVKYAVLAGVAIAAAVPASSAVVISYEAPTAIATTMAGTFAVENFESATPGFNQNFVDAIADGGGHVVTFGYTDVAVRAHDQYTGLGTGNYGATYNGLGFDAHEGPTFALDVASTGGPINFFGAYFSATDASNTLGFYKSGSLVQAFTLGELWGATGVGNQGSLYVDFKFIGGATYDHIVFTQPISCCGFESDNHTVGTWRSGSDTIVVAVPEPASWAMMVGGFGVIGAALRRTRLTFRLMTNRRRS